MGVTSKRLPEGDTGAGKIVGIARRSTRYDAAHAVQAHDKTHKESQKTQVAWALFSKGSPQIGLGQSFTRAHHGPTDGAQHARSSLPDPTALLASACKLL